MVIHMNKRHFFTTGLGIPTILTVFVVLGMSIITLLSYMKEETNSKIVEKEVQYTQEYYLADAKAKYIIETMDEDFMSKHCEKINKQDEELEFIIYINNKNILYIKVGSCGIMTYQIKNVEK